MDHFFSVGDSSSSSSRYGSIQNLCTFSKPSVPSLINVVNPLGTVTTVSEDYLNEDNLIRTEDGLPLECEEILHRSLEAAIKKSDLKTNEKQSNEKQKTSNLNKGALVVPVMELPSKKQEKKSFSHNKNMYNENDITEQNHNNDVMDVIKDETSHFHHQHISDSKAEDTIEPKRKSDVKKKDSRNSTEKSRRNREFNQNQENFDKKEINDVVLSELDPPTSNLVDNELPPPPKSIEPKSRSTRLNKDKVKKYFKPEKEPEITPSNSFQALKAFDLSQIETEFPSLKPLEQLDNLVDDLDQLTIDTEPLNDTSTIKTEPTNYEVLSKLGDKELRISPTDDETTTPITLMFGDNQENHDSDYKSLEMEETNFERMQNENTSSDENTEGSIVIPSKLNVDDDEELCPLLVKSIKCDTNVLVQDEKLVEVVEEPTTNSIDLPSVNNSNPKKRSKKKRK